MEALANARTSTSSTPGDIAATGGRGRSRAGERQRKAAEADRQSRSAADRECTGRSGARQSGSAAGGGGKGGALGSAAGGGGLQSGNAQTRREHGRRKQHPLGTDVRYRGRLPAWGDQAVCLWWSYRPGLLGTGAEHGMSFVCSRFRFPLGAPAVLANLHTLFNVAYGSCNGTLRSALRLKCAFASHEAAMF